MLTRWFYYTRLSLLDLYRLWPSVQSLVIIVAGICLPLLLLLGLKRGHVAMLREDLLRSPTGRQIDVWPGQKGALLRKSSLDRLQGQLAKTDVIIAEAQHLVTLSHQAADGKTYEAAEATLNATAAGDPVLSLYGADVLRPGDRRVVLGKDLARRLHADTGDRLTLRVTRTGGGKAETPVEVAAVLSGSAEGQDFGFLTVDFHDLIQHYVNGGRVAELGWASTGKPVADKYAGYLLFCRPGEDLKPRDHERLRSAGYVADAISDEAVRTLYGILRPNDLRVYFVHTPRSATDPLARLNRSPEDIMDLTDGNDVALFWNQAITGRIQGHPYRIVGCTFPERTWLRAHVAQPGNVFGYDSEEEFLVRFPADPPAGARDRLRLEIGEEAGPHCAVDLNLVARGRPDLADRIASLIGGMSGRFGPLRGLAPALAAQPAHAGTLPVAAVPYRMLAYLDAVLHHTAQFDPEVKRFVAVPEEVTYARARLYARTIDDVPDVERQLREMNYLPVSQGSRILEIHKQDQSLEFIVIVVGLGVWLFGIFTVYNVLNEATARKRGMIGILRVMGMPWMGVFYLIVLRAVILGLIAGALTVGVGVLLPWPLRRLPPLLEVPQALVTMIVITAVGCLLWALLTQLPHPSSSEATGSALPAWRRRLAWVCLAVAVAAFGVETVAWCIQYQPVVVLSQSGDMAWVLASAITCCILGALLPAWESSRLDPFEAIIEGRFR